MPASPPFMNAYGLIPRIFEKIMEARQPPRFTQDFLQTKLGFTGGSARAFISFAKRIGLLNNDGSPTSLYAKIRNSDEQGRAVAEAMQIGYRDIFDRNEYAHELSRDKLNQLVLEITGKEKGSSTVKAIVSSFLALNSFADFDALLREDTDTPERAEAAQSVPHAMPPEPQERHAKERQAPPASQAQQLGLNLAYTINLNLPETTDIEVFNAIFKALKENLLR